jgi:hypothetical protein
MTTPARIPVMRPKNREFDNFFPEWVCSAVIFVAVAQAFLTKIPVAL